MGFLGELVKRTKESHPDFECLKQALESVSKQAFQVNEACDKAENVLKITEVSRTLGIDNLLAAGRKYVREDDIEDTKPDGQIINGRCYVFSDFILISSEKRGKRTNMTIDLDLSWVRDMTQPES